MNLYIQAKIEFSITQPYSTGNVFILSRLNCILINKKDKKKLFNFIKDNNINTYIYDTNEYNEISKKEIKFVNYEDFKKKIRQKDINVLYNLNNIYRESTEISYKEMNKILKIKAYTQKQYETFIYKERLNF